MNERKAVHVFISGRVQGVWFRGWTAKQASALAIDGWVRNLPDGRVEALFSGQEAHLREILRRCAGGPPIARVDKIDTSWIEAPADLRGFERC